MKKRLSNEQGFTLSEILVSIQIFALITLFLYAGFKVFNLVYMSRVKELNTIQKTSLNNYFKFRKINESVVYKSLK